MAMGLMVRRHPCHHHDFGVIPLVPKQGKDAELSIDKKCFYCGSVSIGFDIGTPLMQTLFDIEIESMGKMYRRVLEERAIQLSYSFSGPPVVA